MLLFYKDQLKELRDLVIEKENIIIKYENEKEHGNKIEYEKNVISLIKSGWRIQI